MSAPTTTTAQRFAEMYARRHLHAPALASSLAVPSEATTASNHERPSTTPQPKKKPYKRRVAKKKIPEPTILVSWWPLRASATEVVVCGRKVELDGSSTEWHTSPITQRLSRRLVETKSGRCYQLHGPPRWPPSSKMNGKDSEDMRHHFRDGFPREWYAKVVSTRYDTS